MPRMSMGTRETDQPPLWIATSDLPASPGHPFYTRLNAVLDAHGFDRFAEDQCREFYAKVMGRPSLPPAGPLPVLRAAKPPDRHPLRSKPAATPAECLPL